MLGVSVTPTWAETIDATVEEARELRYVFRRRRRDGALARFISTRNIELLVDGEWVRAWKPPRLERWVRLSDADLREHANAFLVGGFGGASASGLERGERLRRYGIGRWLFPPLAGGAHRNLSDKTIARVREQRIGELPSADLTDLAELKEEALRGHAMLADRCAILEQRANFFLGAAALTSSLVLANSGLLLGTGKLSNPWLSLAAGFLAVSSVCAVVAGLRAMQAAMTSFVRTTPSGVLAILSRATLSGSDLDCAYVGALFVAQNREEVVGNWKLERLKSARRWFLAAVVGVAFLTITVLADVVWARVDVHSASKARPAAQLVRRSRPAVPLDYVELDFKPIS
jgi:hypothetical protein